MIGPVQQKQGNIKLGSSKTSLQKPADVDREHNEHDIRVNMVAAVSLWQKAQDRP